MIIDEDVLEHAGKKGMKWGVRNTPPSTSSGAARASAARTNREQQFREFQKRERNRKIAKGFLIGGGIAAGALVTAALVSNHRKVKASQIKRDAALLKSANSLLKANSAVKLSEARKPIVSGLNPFKNPTGLTGLL